MNAEPRLLKERLIRSYGVRVEGRSCSCGRVISVADLSGNPGIMIHRGRVASVGEASGAAFPITGEGDHPIIRDLQMALLEPRERGLP
ncbi:hypothetical protein KEJ13_09310 [Candidatus Bathyarchaeota archaeon]|nr:hypothetical protein [Candidatus Bathyarchaeota archaeon]